MDTINSETVDMDQLSEPEIILSPSPAIMEVHTKEQSTQTEDLVYMNNVSLF